MNKRIASLLLCFVMVFSLMAIATPAFADTSVYPPITFTIKPDKTTAKPGDTIAYQAILGPVEKLQSAQFELVIPEELEFIDGSCPDGLEAKLGAEKAKFTPSTKIYACYGDGEYTSTGDTVLVNFTCKVKEGVAAGKKPVISILDQVFADPDEGDYVLNFDANGSMVTITAAPKPATNITLNKSELTLTTGDSDTSLTATVTPNDSTDTVVWSSDTPAVATVDATGKVTAVAPGEATITATAGTKTAICKVKVNCAHSSFTLFPEKDSNCTDKGWDAYKKCDLCGKLFDMSDHPIAEIPYRDLNDGHNFDTTAWGYKEADGHAHVCSRNAAHHDTVVPHTAGPAATETTPQTCTECGFVMQPATGHVHATHLTKVDKKDATCTADGNKEYYRCTCGKLFEDAAAATEITDHSSVVIPKTGHSYTVQNSDEAHKRSTAADCREFDTYWYTCANDATHSAKDDAAAADKFYNGEQGAHVYGNEWVDCGEAGHAHKCQHHDAYDAVQPHTPDHEGGATYDYAVMCTDCGRELEPQRVHGSIRVEVPFKLTVKKTGEMDPGQETFKFAVEKFGAPVTYTLVQDTVETNGEKTYEGKFIFTISEDQAGNLSEGFVIHQVKGNAEGWTYDENRFCAIPVFADSYDNVRGWVFLKFDEKGELEYNDPMEEIGFTNSYSAKKPDTPPAPQEPDTPPAPQKPDTPPAPQKPDTPPAPQKPDTPPAPQKPDTPPAPQKPDTPPAPQEPDTPPAPQKPESPKTGDGSTLGLSIALVIVSGAALMGTALYSRRKSR